MVVTLKHVQGRLSGTPERPVGKFTGESGVRDDEWVIEAAQTLEFLGCRILSP